MERIAALRACLQSDIPASIPDPRPARHAGGVNAADREYRRACRPSADPHNILQLIHPRPFHIDSAYLFSINFHRSAQGTDRLHMPDI